MLQPFPLWFNCDLYSCKILVVQHHQLFYTKYFNVIYFFIFIIFINVLLSYTRKIIEEACVTPYSLQPVTDILEELTG